MGSNDPLGLALYPSFGAISKSGTVISLENVEGLSAVGRADEIISTALASLPLEVYREENNGDIVKAKNHPLYNLVNLSPNQYHTSFLWREIAQNHIHFQGNHYCWINRNGNNRAVSLMPIHPRAVTPIVYENEIWYRVVGIADAINARDMIHVTGKGYDGICGIGVIKKYRESLGLGINMRDFGSQFFGNGAHVGGVVTHPKALTPNAKSRLQDTWNAAYSGVDNVGKTAFLDEGMTYNKIGINPRDAQFVEKENLVVQDVARMFGIPEYMLAQGNKVYTNIEQVYLEFVRGTIYPMVKRWEQELNRKLFYQNEQGRYFVRFNLSSLLRGDSKSRAEFYDRLFAVGALSPNDIRKMESMNAIEGGDRYFVPTNNLTPLDKLDEILLARNGGNQTASNE
ncbi:MAG: phage portal protein [Bacteroidota bacterium]